MHRFFLIMVRVVAVFFCLVLLLAGFSLSRASTLEESLDISITVPGTVTPPPPPEPSGSGGHPNTATIELKGYAYPFATLTFLRNGTVIGTSKVDFTGTFSRSMLVPTGEATFGVWARDVNNLISPTANVTLRLADGTVTTISNIAIPPTIYANAVTAGRPLLLFGSAFPQSVVRVFDNLSPQNPPIATRATDEGFWNVATAALKLGIVSFSFKANYQIEFPGIMSGFSFFESSMPRVTCSNADLNGDGKVNIVDFSILLYYWNQDVRMHPAKNPCVDINNDGVVNLKDFSIMMFEWTG